MADFTVPDILDRQDYRRERLDYLQTGFAVWSLYPSTRRARGEACGESRSITVTYDVTEERAKVRTGKVWMVELKHHFYIRYVATKGWGNSRSRNSVIRHNLRVTERTFKTRAEACALAERLYAALLRVINKLAEEE